ncbi:lanthionine synthetase LanC family protein [Streptomyces sp. NPDC059506]|uniref:lanthionine synthetase LanC family protein n=1 Tax=Streptomyces TaxID=1883 RepID=UPI0015FD9812|nr:lanthionine synthetase LanC family protein [Streptomyces sp. SCUT-3]QMV24501.1 hypothetical protein GQS52_25060 [Streptomyces sp. SCUT-3]
MASTAPEYLDTPALPLGGLAEHLARYVAERADGPLPPAPGPGALVEDLCGAAVLRARLGEPDALDLVDQAAAHAASTNAAGVWSGPGLVMTSALIAESALGPGRTSLADDAVGWLAVRARSLSRRQTVRARPGAPLMVYDTVEGLSGVGRVLLEVATADTWLRGAPAGRTAQRSARTCLETLTAILAPHDGDWPGWWLPASDHPDPSRAHPTGAALTGAAHGVAGPLSLLAAAALRGAVVEGQREAIRHAARRLLGWADTLPGGARAWPVAVTGAQLRTGARPVPAPFPAAVTWAEGTPGIARALQLAAAALEDDALHAAAGDLLGSLAARTAVLPDRRPDLFRGVAGVMHAALSARADGPAAREQGDRAGELAHRAAEALLPMFRPHAPYGFTDAAGNPQRLGLLHGAAGVACSLADYAGLPAGGIGWDVALMLR